MPRNLTSPKGPKPRGAKPPTPSGSKGKFGMNTLEDQLMTIIRAQEGPQAAGIGNENVNGDNGEDRYSRKVFVGGLPPDIDEDEIQASFRKYGPLIVDWPHKNESKSYFPPKVSLICVSFYR